MAKYPFVKLEGLGNDFLLFDGLSHPLPTSLTAREVVRTLCDRRFGVGGDGILLVTPAQGEAVARMRVLNADGSEPEMCGNGLRCVARFLELEGHINRGSSFALATGAGDKTSVIDEEGQIEVDMGAPAFGPADVGLLSETPWIERPLEVSGRSLPATALSMGNPHLVLFFDHEGNDLEALARDLGPTLEHHPSFPQRVNIEIARVTSGSEIEAWVWERGAGITLACGTGASAVAVAAVRTSRLEGPRVNVRLPGGQLEISYDRETESVRMRGPAQEVFRGVVEIEG